MTQKKSYDLSNHIKVPRKKKGMLTTSKINYFHGRFSVPSALRSPFKLKILNCPHRHRSELSVHKGLPIENITREHCFIVDLYVVQHHFGVLLEVNILLIHELFYNGRKIFQLKKKNHRSNENDICSMEICDVSKNNNYGNVEGNGTFINLRLVKKVNTKINENQKRITLTLSMIT